MVHTQVSQDLHRHRHRHRYRYRYRYRHRHRHRHRRAGADTPRQRPATVPTVGRVRLWRQLLADMDWVRRARVCSTRLVCSTRRVGHVCAMDVLRCG